MHHIQCNWYTSVWDACGLCYFTQVLPAVLLYCCGLAFLGLVAWSQFCGYRSAARLMKSRITRIRLLFSKQFESETSFRSNLRNSWLLGGPNWTEVPEAADNILMVRNSNMSELCRFSNFAQVSFLKKKRSSRHFNAGKNMIYLRGKKVLQRIVCHVGYKRHKKIPLSMIITDCPIQII